MLSDHILLHLVEVMLQWGYNSKIVADGGFRNYDDIIKALALGADYVMLGGMLNKSLESCSDTLLFGKFKLSKERAIKIWEKYPFMRKYLYKKFRGMSTKEVQKKWGRGKIKTSEGVHRMNKGVLGIIDSGLNYQSLCKG